MEIQFSRVNEEVRDLRRKFPSSRFLLVCQNCYQLKPPIVVECGNSSECSWCHGRNKALLFETKQSSEEKSEWVEYAKIRERKSQSQFANSECNDNLGLRWRTCKHGDECKFAHSWIECRVWQLESRRGIKWKDIVNHYSLGQSANRDTLHGVFHCFACRKNITTRKEFSAHCDSYSHKDLVESLITSEWKHRPLPEPIPECFSLCPSLESILFSHMLKSGPELLFKSAECSQFNCSEVGAYRCHDGEVCSFAHSEKELQEWKKRFRLQEEIQRKIAETGLLSFADQIHKEYRKSSSRTEIMTDSLPNVRVLPDKKLQQQVLPNECHLAWKLKIKCRDLTMTSFSLATKLFPDWITTLTSFQVDFDAKKICSVMKLNHAAFIPFPGHDYFTICGLRGGKQSNPTKHIDFTVMLDEDAYNLRDGEATFLVNFTSERGSAPYGMTRGSLVFEFRSTSRTGSLARFGSLLLVEFKVEVVGKDDVAYVQSTRQPETDDIWEKSRKIIRWNDDSENEFETMVRSLSCKYKEPVAALDNFDATDGTKNAFDHQHLLASNYVKEMHKFLYREEAARTEKLSGPKSFFVAMSDNYISSYGTSFNVPGQLFAVFELQSNLSRDTDEGLLILDSCNKVLIGRKPSSNQPVYEAKIQEKFVDHIVLLFSKMCVEDWNLKTGDVLEVDIKFQLDRKRFCCCHLALDLLEEQKLLPLVCPDPKLVAKNVQNNCICYKDLDELKLDSDQAAVLQFLLSKPPTPLDSVLPLFLMQGSFGTGKTYTISKCVLFLLRSDSNAKILICTHSNIAADHYIESNMEELLIWKDKVVRVVYHGRHPAAVNHRVKDFCLPNKMGNGFRYPTAKEIASYRVFITTFTTALVLGSKGSGISGAFTHIFLDEAAQAMEAETIIPLTIARSINTKVIIAGDHKQIAEKIHSKENFKDSNFTLLERIFNVYYSSFETMVHSNLVCLRNNYRCVEPILRLIESIFYKKGFFRPQTSSVAPQNLKPIQFHNVEGRCLQDSFSSDYYNLAEVYRIADVVNSLVLSFEDDIRQNDIVVVSSYNCQVNMLRSHLKKKGLNKVKVNGVRGIQGLEYKVVILSCVHRRETTNDTEGANFGLLSDLNLLNTAFTRSMLSVIAVGHGPTLLSLGRCGSVWSIFLKACTAQKSLFPPNTSLSSIQFSAFNPSGGKTETDNQENEHMAEDVSQQNFSDSEDFDDELILPFEDDILSKIIEKDTGSRPDELAVKVVASGKEIFEADPLRSAVSQNQLPGEFSRNQLEDLLHSYPDEYKRCVLKMISWYSAEATVFDKDSNVKKIMIKTKQALGKAFNGDEVVVHIRNQDNGGSTIAFDLLTVLMQNAGGYDDTKVFYGKVIGILERYEDPLQKKFVCIVDKFSRGLMVPVNQKTTKFVVWGSERMREEGIVSLCKLNKNQADIDCYDKVEIDVNSKSIESVYHFVVRFLKWLPDKTYPYGYVSEVIKPKEVEKYFSKVYDVPPIEPKNPAVLIEAKKMVEKNLSTAERLDLTDLFVFTIDPKGSKDLDDALSIKRCREHIACWEIGIHVSDVASVVREGTSLDKDARNRATTFYSGVVKYNGSSGKSKVTPMLPDVLSAKKCSLLPDGIIRPAISLLIHSSRLPNIVSPSKDLTEANIPPPLLTTIRSRRQLTYKDAENYLRRVKKNGHTPISCATDENLPDQLYGIWESMLNLRLKRLRGAAFTNRPEFDELSEFYEETTAHMLIEEAMITYNACISIFLEANECTFLLRTQDHPIPSESLKWKTDNSQFIELSLNQKFCLSKLSHDPRQHRGEVPEVVSLPVLPDVWEQIDLAIERNDLESALVLFCSDAIQPAVCPALSTFLGIQKKAKMEVNTEVKKTHPDGAVSHFSLGLPLYSFCSSPIRRYNDIMVQRLVIQLKCQKNKKQPQNFDGVITLGNVGQPERPEHLEIVSKRLEKRMEEAKNYEQDTQKVLFAKNLSRKRRYDMAIVVETTKSDIFLSFTSLRDLPLSCCKLPLSELNIQSIERNDETTLIWRIRFYDVKAKGKRPTGVSHRQLVSTTVSSKEWRNMVSCIRNSYLSNPHSSHVRKSAKQMFKSDYSICVLSGLQHCNMREYDSLMSDEYQQPYFTIHDLTCSIHAHENEGDRCDQRQGDLPCNRDGCKQCKDIYCYQSKLGIKHYRQISRNFSLGMPVCVQLYCTLKRGICTASAQMLSLSQDLDICLAHLRSPIETFAADVTQHKGDHVKQTFLYHCFDSIKPSTFIMSMEAIYNAIKNSNSSRNTNFTLQNVEVKLNFQGGKTKKPGGSFSLDEKFCSERLIGIAVNDFLCLRIKNLSVTKMPNEEGLKENPPPGNCFTWIAHAVVHKVVLHKKIIVDEVEPPPVYHFKFCASPVSKLKLSPLKDATSVVTVEVLKLGISDRFVAQALHKVTEDSLCNEQIINSLCVDEDMPSEQLVVENVEKYGINVGSEIIPGMKFKLNDGQIKQIKLALERNISMIQGPPGTGKSFIGAHLAYYFRELNMKKYKERGKILYCGPSNKSVDVVAEYLLHSRLKVLRVYGSTYEEQDYPNPLRPVLPQKKSEKRPDKKIADLTLHHRIRRDGSLYADKIRGYEKRFSKLKGEELYGVFEKHKTAVAMAKRAEIKDHDVIVCTCATAAMLQTKLEVNVNEVKKKFQEKMEPVKFTQCIIDECGMCSEPETLAPIVSSQAKQVVLIGDHMQLQPIIMCQKAREFGLGVSMFERLKKHAGMLTNQYRMHSGICSFPSKQFYKSSLTTDQSVMEREAGRPFRFCYPATSYQNTAIFCQVHGVETVNYGSDRGGDNSVSNETEARAVIRILTYLHLNMKVKLSKIMILTPYIAQVRTISEIIEKERSHLVDVHVGTVITSQGSENDYVILSTVRSQPRSAIEDEAPFRWRRKFIGFVADPHQINVAITRAKSGLCIVGNKNVLEKDTETWKCLLESYEKSGSIVELDSPDAPWNVHQGN